VVQTCRFKIANGKERLGDLERLVFPWLGTKPIEAIKRSDIIRVLDRIADGEDIKKNGLKHKPFLWWPQEDKPPILLDGRNRLDAMELIGIEIPFASTKAILYCSPKGEKFLNFFDVKLDPYAYVISANIHRRHLTAEQKRELIAKLLKADPTKSDRTIAKNTKVSDKTVGAVRRRMEGRAEIPHAETRADTKGRQQPARKPKAVQVTAGPAGPAGSAAIAAPPAAQSAEDRKAIYAADEDAGIAAVQPSPPVAHAESATPTDDADHDYTSQEQDQILRFMLTLLATVDHPHSKKFYKFLKSATGDGDSPYLPSCSARGWANGGYPVDASLIDRVSRGAKQLCCRGAAVEPVAADPVEAVADIIPEAAAPVEPTPQPTPESPQIPDPPQLSADNPADVKSLRERAKRLGFRVERRGKSFGLRYDDGTGMGGDIQHVSDYMHAVEFKLPWGVMTECGIPIFGINLPKGTPGWSETHPDAETERTITDAEVVTPPLAPALSPAADGIPDFLRRARTEVPV
jgi:hypothetical protein